MAQNAAIAMGLTVLVPLSGGPLEPVATVFFLLLLSVLVAMCDRYRIRFLARFRAA